MAKRYGKIIRLLQRPVLWQMAGWLLGAMGPACAECAGECSSVYKRSSATVLVALHGLLGAL